MELEQQQMADGGGDMLTPDMVLAAAGPPQEALGACDGHTNGSFEEGTGTRIQKLRPKYA